MLPQDSLEKLVSKLNDVDKRLTVIENEVSNHIRSDLAFLRLQMWTLFGLVVAAALGGHFWR